MGYFSCSTRAPSPENKPVLHWPLRSGRTMSKPPAQRIRKFRLESPQRIAALLLMMFTAQCLLVLGANQATPSDIHYTTCGSQMWAAYSSNTLNPAYCPKITEGPLAYRAAGLPLAIHNWLAGLPADAEPTNLFITLNHLAFWLRLPFLLAGIGLGACLWWVTRRLFGDPGGYVALGLYCFTPPIILNSALPNNGILAAFGIFAAIYTAMGVAHAMQGPRRRWIKRIVLLAITLGFTAAASIPAFLLALVIGTGLLIWLAEDRRKFLPVLTLIWTTGALLIFFAASGFQPSAFGAFLHLLPVASGTLFLPHFVLGTSTAPIRIALVIAVIGYAVMRRARYFGNTTPLGIAALLILLAASSITPSAWLWTIPFLFTFMGGVYADLLESRLRTPALLVCSLVLLAQALFSLGALSSMIIR